jgi:hypothetical protein
MMQVESTTRPLGQVAAPPQITTLEEPDARYPQPGEVVRYVQALQQLDQELARALGGARRGDRVALLQERAAIDVAIAHQVTRAGRRLGRERADSLATLNALFKLGHAPEPAINGRTRGQLVTSTLLGPLDSFGRAVTRQWIPWKGKRFFAADSRGDNIFTPESPYVGRVIWPTFRGFHPYENGLFTEFPFQTSAGPGLLDPEITTLKLDYDLPGNPHFLIRAVLDELVQLSANYYLGKVYFNIPRGHYVLSAFFALHRES